MEKDNFSVKNILLNVKKNNESTLQEKLQENGRFSDNGKSEEIDQSISKNYKIHKPKAIRPLIGKE